MSLSRPAFWSKRSLPGFLLWPVSLIFSFIVFLRRTVYRAGVLSSWRSPVPVVVIGNITVGGAGKTPLVIAFSELLTKREYRIGIVTRGYGGVVNETPVVATADSDPAIVGDESVLLASRTELPVVVSANRAEAIRHLLANFNIDCVLCDDGLQHYALQRDLEIAVIDSEYLFGNRFCLPAGPLRESIKRLDSVDMKVYSGNNRTVPDKLPGYSLVGSNLVSVNDSANVVSIESFAGKRVHAVAGIASPANFFEFLRAKNIDVVPHGFADHAKYQHSDLLFNDDLPVVMTEKDKVKCSRFNKKNCWYIPVKAELDYSITEEFITHVERVFSMRKSNAD